MLILDSIIEQKMYFFRTKEFKEEFFLLRMVYSTL